MYCTIYYLNEFTRRITILFRCFTSSKLLPTILFLYSQTPSDILLNQHKAKRSRLKLTDAQRLASPHRSFLTSKTTLATEKHSVLRGCIPRYALALHATSKVSDTILPSDIRSCLNRHTLEEQVDFVVSQNLTTARNGYHTLHKWVDRRAEAKRETSSISSFTSNLNRFKLNKASVRLYHRDNAITLATPSTVSSSSFSSTSLVTSS